MTVPQNPKIYHIVHENRLKSIVANGGLLCDARAVSQNMPGATIGMGSIKHRRLTELTLNSHQGLYVGQCVPFYFCPRSIMLYVIYQANHPNLSYRGGQEPIIHLEADLRKSVSWADAQGKRWAFTSSNAGARYFEDYADLSMLDEINWSAVQATDWKNCKDGKQAEFLMEDFFPWCLVEKIGVHSQTIHQQVSNALSGSSHKPQVDIERDWYY